MAQTRNAVPIREDFARMAIMREVLGVDLIESQFGVFLARCVRIVSVLPIEPQHLRFGFTLVRSAILEESMVMKMEVLWCAGPVMAIVNAGLGSVIVCSSGGGGTHIGPVDFDDARIVVLTQMEMYLEREFGSTDRGKRAAQDLKLVRAVLVPLRHASGAAGSARTTSPPRAR